MPDLLPWERRLWRQRSWWAPRTESVLTDIRLIVRRGRDTREIALADITDVARVRTVTDRLSGTSTLVVRSRYEQQPPLTLPHLRRGEQLAALLELLSGDEGDRDYRGDKADKVTRVDEADVAAVLAWTPRTRGVRPGQAVAAVLATAVAIAGVAIGLQGEAAAIVYPTSDAIYPRGVKRDREAIVQFMERDVLPWAKRTLAPVVGSADRVTCRTCHGPEPERADWRMPGVAALPEPHVKPIGSSASADTVDAQMRNAIYGYLAESDNHAKAAYMREVVVPGIARLLGRPGYDFTKTYEYNRTRFAIGCYHCHQVADLVPAS